MYFCSASTKEKQWQEAASCLHLLFLIANFVGVYNAFWLLPPHFILLAEISELENFLTTEGTQKKNPKYFKRFLKKTNF